MALRIPKFLWDLFNIPKPTISDNNKALVWNDATASFQYINAGDIAIVEVSSQQQRDDAFAAGAKIVIRTDLLQ
jgi:hypothetical protein